MTLEELDQETQRTTSASGESATQTGPQRSTRSEPFEGSYRPLTVFDEANHTFCEPLEGAKAPPTNARNARRDNDGERAERFYDRDDADRVPRVEIDLTDGYDPYELVPFAWKL